MKSRELQLCLDRKSNLAPPAKLITLITRGRPLTTMIVRVQSKNGTKRITANSSDLLRTLLEKVS